MARIEISADEMRPVIAATVREVLRQIEADRSEIDRTGKLAYSEAEAARLMSLKPHQLRDERLDGRISASVSRGRKILYSKSDLLSYLESRKWTPKD